MAEAIAAFGLACNVMSVISTALDLCHVVHSISEHGSVDPSLESKAQALHTLSEDMNQMMVSTRRNATRRTPQEQTRYDQLHQLARNCSRSSNALQSEIQKVTPKSDNLLRKAGAAFLVLVWYKSKIKKLEEEMKSHQEVLSSKILVHLFTKAEASEIQHQAGFANLDSTLQHFITQYSQGHTALKDLLGAQSDRIVQIVQDENRTLMQVVVSSAHDTTTEFNQHIDSMGQLVRNSAHNTTTQLKQHIDFKEEKETFFKSLRYESLNSRKNQIGAAYSTTFNWALDEGSPFKEWVTSKDKVFWVQGKAGSGKSTFMKFLISQSQTLNLLQPDSNAPNMVLLSYFHWSAGGPEQSSFHSFLCSLLFQALGEERDDHISRLLDKNTTWKRKETPLDWSTEELEAAFEHTTTESKHSYCLFIDGLDEFRDDDGPSVLGEYLMQISTYPRDNIRMCVSSRAEQYFRDKLGKFPHLTMEDMTKEDMEKMVTEKLTKCYSETCQRKAAVGQKPKLSSEDVENIRTTILEMAHGVFLWAHFVLISVIGGFQNNDEPAVLLKRLQKTPMKLEQLYHDMVARMDPVYHEYTGRLFNSAIELPRLRLTFAKRFREIPKVVYQPTVLTYAAILESQKFESILSNPGLESIEEIVEILSDTAQAIQVRSSGMIEVHPSSPQRIDFIHAKAELIHQSALSFLEAPSSQHVLNAGPISELEILKGVFYSGLTSMILLKHDGLREDIDYDMESDLWSLLHLFSSLFSYEEWETCALLYYHVGRYCSQFYSLEGFLIDACRRRFYRLVTNILQGKVELSEKPDELRKPLRQDYEYDKTDLIYETVEFLLGNGWLTHFEETKKGMKDCNVLVRYLLESGSDANEVPTSAWSGRKDGNPMWTFMKRISHCVDDLGYHGSKMGEKERTEFLNWVGEMSALFAKFGDLKSTVLTMWVVGSTSEQAFTSFGPPFFLNASQPTTYRVVIFEDTFVSHLKAVYLNLEGGIRGSTAQKDVKGIQHTSLNVLDSAGRRRPVLLAKIEAGAIDLRFSGYNQMVYYKRGGWFGDILRLGFADVVPVAQDDIEKLDEFMSNDLARDLQWFDSLVEARAPQQQADSTKMKDDQAPEEDSNAKREYQNSSSPIEQESIKKAIKEAVESGELEEPNEYCTYFRTAAYNAFEPLSKGLKFYVPKSSETLNLDPKTYKFEKYLYGERNLRFANRSMRWL